VIQITPQMKILVAIEAVDGRKGIDSLARLCEEKLQADPFSGCLFLFRSRRGTSIRILVYDGKDFGWHRNVCRKDVSSGGRMASSRREYWRFIRHSYYWPPAIRKQKRRQCCAG
jgi:IS66 Orf2 like protein